MTSNWSQIAGKRIIVPPWEMYEDLTDLGGLGAASVLIVIAALSILGNAIVGYYFTRTNKLAIHQMFALNLALCEICLPISSFWMSISSFVIGKWIYGPLGCKIYGFLNGFLGMTAVATVAAKAVDCYVQTCCSPRFRKNPKTLRRLRVRLCTLTWIYGVFFASPPFYGWGNYVLEGYGRSCSFNYVSDKLGDMTFMGFLMIGGFVAPSIVIVLSYGKAYRYMNELTRYSGIGTCKLNIRKISSAKLKKLMLRAALNPTFVCWTPYVLIVWAAHFGLFQVANPSTILVTVFTAKLSGIYGPLMNFKSVRKLRRNFPSRSRTCQEEFV